MHFARVAGENLVSPDEKATGDRHLRVRRLPRGLSASACRWAARAALTDALIACIEDHGGEVLANVDVRAGQGDRTAAPAGVATARRPRIRRPRTPSSARSIRICSARWSTGWSRMVRARCRSDAHHPRRLHHRARRARTSRCRFRAGDTSTAVMIELLPDELRHAAPALRQPALRRVRAASRWSGLGSLSAVRSLARARRARRSCMRGTTCPTSAPDGRSWDESQGRICRAHDRAHAEVHREHDAENILA